jgi:hypothetical protein
MYLFDDELAPTLQPEEAPSGGGMPEPADASAVPRAPTPPSGVGTHLSVSARTRRFSRKRLLLSVVLLVGLGSLVRDLGQFQVMIIKN